MHVEASGQAFPEVTSMKIRVPQHVVYRTLATETVALNVQTGMYYGLNQTAGRMLEVLERAGDLDAALAQLVPELEAPEERIRSDIIGLCIYLESKGLIEVETGS
jgi:hypothetical protein